MPATRIKKRGLSPFVAAFIGGPGAGAVELRLSVIAIRRIFMGAAEQGKQILGKGADAREAGFICFQTLRG
jgi:hypothetical protein